MSESFRISVRPAIGSWNQGINVCGLCTLQVRNKVLDNTIQCLKIRLYIFHRLYILMQMHVLNQFVATSHIIISPDGSLSCNLIVHLKQQLNYQHLLLQAHERLNYSIDKETLIVPHTQNQEYFELNCDHTTNK